MPYWLLFVCLALALTSSPYAQAAEDVQGPEAPVQVVPSPEEASVPADYPEDFSTPETAELPPVAHNAFGEDEVPSELAPPADEWGGDPQTPE